MSKPFTFNFSTPSTSTPSTTTGSTGTTGTSSTTSNFTFNITKPNNTTNTTKTTDQPVNIPPEIKNKSIKELIEIWESQLEQQVKQFNTQARQVARWDRSIYDILELMMFLERQIKSVETTQKELLASASSLLQEQKNFLQTLRDKIPSKKGEELLTSSDQRAILYNTASKLGKEFHKMESQLKEIVEKTENNESQDSISDIDKVVKISNCHLDSLQYISNCCAYIEEKLNEIDNHLH